MFLALQALQSLYNKKIVAANTIYCDQKHTFLISKHSKHLTKKGKTVNVLRYYLIYSIMIEKNTQNKKQCHCLLLSFWLLCVLSCYIPFLACLFFMMTLAAFCNHLSVGGTGVALRGAIAPPKTLKAPPKHTQEMLNQFWEGCDLTLNLDMAVISTLKQRYEVVGTS